MKSSFSSRSLKLLALAASVGRKEVTQNLKDRFVQGLDDLSAGRISTRLEQARMITEYLSQLKGAAMKAGQLLSLDAADFFPPEAVEILATLQGQAEPVPWDTIRTVLEQDLGADKLKQFTDLQTVAAASASIGQVHRARYHGEPVAVKIQYPGIRESIDSDLKILKKLLQGLLGITGRKIDISEAFDELAMVLHQEADYERELGNMLEYQQIISEFDHLVMPTPIAEMSSQRVLTMTWQEGISLSEWLKTKPTRDEKNQVGRWLLELFLKEFYKFGLVQTDPNYGNFLIQTKPLKLVILDFGATLRYPIEFRQNYVKLLNAMNSFDDAQTLKAFYEVGWIDERESSESKRLFLDFLRLSLEPFDPARQPFRFADTDYSRRTRDATRKFSESLKYSPPPRSVIFLHRKLGGVFAFLKKLEAEIDVLKYWQDALKINE